MEKHLTWTKGLLENTYQLFENGLIINSLFFDTWKNEARSIGKENTFLFKTNSFFDSNTQILTSNGEIVGVINFDLWQTKAVVNLKSGEQYACNFSNYWFSKWTITNFKDKQLFYYSSTTTGTITTNTDDELIVLSGLFIREHYSRVLVLFIIFVAMFVTIVT